MKKKRGKKINIKLSNHWLYTFIVLGILAIIGVGVWAAVPNAGRTIGHPANDIEFCGANKILKMNSAGNSWTCADDIDTDTTITCRQVSRASSTPASGGIIANYAACNNDEILTGGGGYCPNGYLLYSYPSSSYPSGPRWIVGCSKGSTQNSAYAICCSQ